MVRFMIAGWIAVLAWASASGAWAAPRNVMMIVADDLGRDMGCYGHPVIKTPNIDRLASEGTRFTGAYCTTASCSASRSVILTGLFNHANGQYGLFHAAHAFRTHEWVRGLPRLLGEAGYRTACLGKYHVGPDSAYGFGELATQGLEGNRGPEGFASQARRVIGEADAQQQPFFVYACSADPHRDFGNSRSYRGETPVKYAADDMIVPPWLPDTPACRGELAEYAQAASRFDQVVGQLLAVLEDTGHAGDTLVLVLSDNGPAFPGAKTTVYEPGIRLPLVVRQPQWAADAAVRGVVSDALVSWVDLAPTILDYAGVAPPDYGLQGRSFLSILAEAGRPAGWNELFASHSFHEVQMYYPMRVVREGPYKYILNVAHELPFPFASDLYGSATWQEALASDRPLYGKRRVEDYVHRPRHELYDLDADPDELVNLADRPEHAERLQAMQATLRAWQAATKDPWASKWRYE